MKSFVGSITIALFVMVAVRKSNSVRVCPVQCNSSGTNVCGIIQNTNTCRLFTNECNFRLYNCNRNIPLGRVALSRCRGTAVGSSRTCRATTSTGTLGNINGLNGLSGVSGLNGVNGLSGLGLGSSSPSVNPIVIQV